MTKKEISLESLLDKKNKSKLTVVNNSFLDTNEKYSLDTKSYKQQQFSKFNHLVYSSL